MARKQSQPTPTAAPAVASPVSPISFSQARQRRRPGKPGKIQNTTSEKQSAADQMASRALLKERVEVTGRLDPYHAHRGGYWQGALDALSMLEVLVNDGTDLDTTLCELRAWLMGDAFGQWVNAPDDPTEISPVQWLARREGTSSPPSQPPSA